MNKSIITRLIIGIVLIVVLFAGYKTLEYVTLDPDLGNFESVGVVTAVEYTDEGSQIVMFDSEGNKTVIPGIDPGDMDLDPVWRPDGQRIFFVSNRNNQSYNIFRWNPAKDKVQQRSHGSRSKSTPSFGPAGWPDIEDSALIISGGTVLEFNQRLQRTWQKLPPTNFEGSENENAQGAFDAMYSRIGTSFKSAMWGPDRKVIFAVMHRETDEVFIVNYMEDIGIANAGPQTVFSADTIQFDVGSDGTAVVSLRGFQFYDPSTIPEQFVKNGTAYKPYTNGTFVLQVQDDGNLNIFPIDTDQADLGVFPAEITAENRAEHAIPDVIDGLLIEDMVPKYGAANIGMKAGDVLLTINGTEVKTPNALFTSLADVLIGEPVTIRYYESGDNAGVHEVTYAFGQEPSRALIDPAISPDSTMVACVVGTVEGGINFNAFELVLIPLSQEGISNRTRLIQGTVFQPSWHPDGMSLVYAKSGPAGDSQLYTINSDGSRDTQLSGIGDFTNPSFSPQKKE